MKDSKAQHTPGPWRIDLGGGHAHNSIRGAGDIQTNGWLHRVGGFSNASYSDRVCENLGDLSLPGPAANARLIAAAPELLELVESLLPLVCGISNEDIALENEVERLLAKIRGE